MLGQRGLRLELNEKLLRHKTRGIEVKVASPLLNQWRFFLRGIAIKKAVYQRRRSEALVQCKA